MGQTENDMVLGTSSYKNGLRATTFGPRDKGIGYLVGATDDPQIVRTAYIDGPAAEAIGARARALREAAGTLSGHALGEGPDAQEDRPRRSILADIAAVFGPDEDRLWSEVIAQRLAEQWPTTLHRHHPSIAGREPEAVRARPGAGVGHRPRHRRVAQPARLPPRRRHHRLDGHPRAGRRSCRQRGRPGSK
jgi:S-DNA-T family DNA segregation ATPase FtsK/SpoIIIE